MDAIAIMFYGGETWTWRQTLELTQRTAKGLQAMGVKKGDHVLPWQPNNREAVFTWFGLKGDRINDSHLTLAEKQAVCDKIMQEKPNVEI